MPKGSRAVTYHEIRDPIHAFVRLDSSEMQAVNSIPFQRLRYIHQLALTSLVYPAATHKRFEHCLGVMELAGRVYDVVTNPINILPSMNYLVPRVGEHDFTYWRRVVRMAALCHDVGHLPYSHAAEDLLEGLKHEDMTRALIESDLMLPVWESLKLRATDVSKIAVGAKHHSLPLDEWESILSEIIIGDTFGVDRMDYLLRDSHHVGVAYGRFDHFRLIDTIRILPKGDVGNPKPDNDSQLQLPLEPVDKDNLVNDQKRRWDEQEASREPTLGIENGGLQSAEGLLWARQFMWSQVYLHPTRQVYDLHLADFLRAWLPTGKFNVDVHKYVQLTDNEVCSALAAASLDPELVGHDAAKCIMQRRHFRRIYETKPSDKKIALDAPERIFGALVKQYGKENVKIKTRDPKPEGKHFPVLLSSGEVESSTALPRPSIECRSSHREMSTFILSYGTKQKAGWISIKRIYSVQSKAKRRRKLHKLQVAAIVQELGSSMRQHGSWMGETHLQKATYFLQTLLKVPLEFEFILYKHGPFSFELRDFLVFMEGEQFVRWQAAQPPYGPSIRSGPMSPTLTKQFGFAAERYKSQIEFVAKSLGRKNVAELERIGTALYVTEEGTSDAARANRIKQLKPHLEIAKIQDALSEFDEMRGAVPSIP